jgi:arsenate reductase (thioredoxin)
MFSNRLFSFLGIGTLSMANMPSIRSMADESRLAQSLDKYVTARISEFDQISEDRKSELTPLSEFIQQQLKSGKAIKLVFICTHNSRRSHMSQIWASVAATKYGISGVDTYSGGTEATAFNPRAIAALQRAGLEITKSEGDTNPRYQVRFSETQKPLICFSKKYDDEANPSDGFCAVMTCTQADKGCPVVRGAQSRIAIPFDDPKVADGTPLESAKYDERCQQIAREMLFVFSRVRKD